MSDSLLVTVEDGVATLAFNRPDVLNALDETMILAFRDAVERMASDDSIRCVVLRGEGSAFLAGGDVAMFAAHLDDLPRLSLAMARQLHFGILALRRMPKPAIASVHGAVAGAGISIMAACDLAIAADNTRFTAAYSSIGTSPDGGASYFLSKCMGPRRALEFLLLSEPVDAMTALSFGLVNRVIPLEDLMPTTTHWARRLAQGPTRAYARTKRLVENAAVASLEAHLEAEALAFSRSAGSNDMREGIAAFIAKRKPRFVGQ